MSKNSSTAKVVVLAFSLLEIYCRIKDTLERCYRLFDFDVDEAIICGLASACLCAKAAMSDMWVKVFSTNDGNKLFDQ